MPGTCRLLTDFINIVNLLVDVSHDDLLPSTQKIVNANTLTTWINKLSKLW